MYISKFLRLSLFFLVWTVSDFFLIYEKIKITSRRISQWHRPRSSCKHKQKVSNGPQIFFLSGMAPYNPPIIEWDTTLCYAYQSVNLRKLSWILIGAWWFVNRFFSCLILYMTLIWHQAMRKLTTRQYQLILYFFYRRLLVLEFFSEDNDFLNLLQSAAT